MKPPENWEPGDSGSSGDPAAPPAASRRFRGVRRWLLELHLYLGLVCAPYFALLGLSGLAYNHAGATSQPWSVREWSAEITGAESAAPGDHAEAERIKRSLGLLGYVPKWTLKQSGEGALRFKVARPGRSYAITLEPDGRRARVIETRTGPFGLLRSIHGPVRIEGAPIWSTAWRLYTDLSMGALVFAVASGGLLMWPRRKERRAGALAFVLGSAVLAGLALWLWW